MDKVRNYYFIDGNKTSKGNEIHLYLIIYDIIDNRIRNKIFKKLKSYGASVQKSAFELYLSDKQFTKVERFINCTIDKEKDSVKIYKLNSMNMVFNIGKSKKEKYENFIVL